MASTFSPWGRPNLGVHSTNTNGAPTVCWAQGHSEASKGPVLMEFTILKRTKSRVLPPYVPSLGPCGRRQIIGPRLLTAHQHCHLSELPLDRMGR